MLESYGIATNERLRALMREAARTASYDGGDRLLARDLTRECARLGEMSMNALYHNGRFSEYVALAIDVGRDYLLIKDWEAADTILRRGKIGLIDSPDNEEQQKDINELLAAVWYWGFSRGARRGSTHRRRRRQERRMLWRNEVTKKPLRRVVESHREKKVTRSARWYAVQRRVNDRANAS